MNNQYNTILIYRWTGRLGNNLYQLLNAIYYGLNNNISKIYFPDHPYFKKKIILLKENKAKEKILIKEFFYIKELGNCIPNTIDKIKIANNYIKPILKLNYKEESIRENNNKLLTIYIRSDDIFNGHDKYVLPPVAYYEFIIEKYKYSKILIVTHPSKNNPCIQPLLKKYKNICSVQSSDNVLLDYTMLSTASNIVLCTSSYCWTAILFNKNLKNIYSPLSAYNFYNDSFKLNQNTSIKMFKDIYDTNIYLYDLKNYPIEGEWCRNIPAEKQLMISYDIKNIIEHCL